MSINRLTWIYDLNLELEINQEGYTMCGAILYKEMYIILCDDGCLCSFADEVK